MVINMCIDNFFGTLSYNSSFTALQQLSSVVSFIFLSEVSKTGLIL